MKTLSFVLFFLVFSLLIGQVSANSYVSFTEPLFSYYGGSTWFQDPRAVEYNNVIYTSYVAPNRNITISSYNIISRTTNTFVLFTSSGIVDDHLEPAILIRPDGKILVAYASDAGDGGNGKLFTRISSNPEDITSFQDANTLDNGSSSNHAFFQLIYLPSEQKTYLFHLNTTGSNSYWSLRNSTDNGTTWGNETNILVHQPNNLLFYSKIETNGNDSIHFVASEHPYIENSSIFYMKYNNTGSYYHANGSLITDSLPFQFSSLDRVYNYSIGGNRSWLYDIAVNGSGIPFIVYSTIVNNYTDHRYNYAYWNGTSWNLTEITTAGGTLEDDTTSTAGSRGSVEYSGGIILDHLDTTIVYMSRNVTGTFEISKGIRQYNGSWVFENITTNSRKKNFRPVSIRNHTLIPIVWQYGRYGWYGDYDTYVLTKNPYSYSLVNLTINQGTNNLELRQQMDDYISYWRADGTAKDENRTSANDGTLNGGMGYNTSGKYGQAFQFDGINDYISIPDNSTQRGLGKLSITGWIYKNTKDIKIVEKWNPANPHYIFRELSGQLQFYIRTSSTVGGNVSIIPESGWHFYAAVYNGSKMMAYKDLVIGSIILNQTGTISNVATNSIIIGAEYDSTNPSDQLADDIRIYDRALNLSELSLIKNQSKYSSGYIKSWYNSSPNISYRVDVNGTNQTNSNVSLQVIANGSTPSAFEAAANQSLNHSWAVIGFTNTDAYIWLFGNGTSTPQISNITFYDRTVTTTTTKLNPSVAVGVAAMGIAVSIAVYTMYRRRGRPPMMFIPGFL